ncbi:helix-turn-helix domain-containing protein [Pedobacter frigoris]|nr:helix-turn-helix domain-containing protein [Pedobacter frigoris]
MDQLVSVVEKKNPTSVLQPYISEYVFRAISVPDCQPLIKAMPFRVGASVDFFLGDPFDTVNCHTKALESFERCTIRGARTHKKYTITISGQFVSFSIRFKPTGLYRLLGMPANLFCNQTVNGELVHSFFKEVTQRLMGCINIYKCIQIVEPYLLGLLLKHTKIRASKQVDHMVTLISSAKAPANITTFLQQVCLSERQLERNFVKEIGTTPKLYSNMTRFENLLYDRMNFPDQSWTSLAYKFNYYDQMHLIRTFQSFLGVNPSDFACEDFAV